MATDIEQAVRKALATVPEVADYLHVSRAKVYLIMESGDLPYVKIGKSRRVRWEDVDRLVATSLIGAMRGTD